MHHPTDSPTVLAARLTGQRRAFVALLVDADLGPDVRPDRAEVFLGADGLIDWSRSPLPGSVTDWHRAEVGPGIGDINTNSNDSTPSVKDTVGGAA